MSKIVSFVRREPVRAYLYSLTAATLTLLATIGVIDTGQALAVGSFAATVLAVEKTRSRVTPASGD